jgi:hypothetical protein
VSGTAISCCPTAIGAPRQRTWPPAPHHVGGVPARTTRRNPPFLSSPATASLGYRREFHGVLQQESNVKLAQIASELSELYNILAGSWFALLR